MPSTPIRIAFCITELEPGGAERFLVELVNRLDRQQFEPVVYCLGPRPTGNPTSLADLLEKNGATVHCFGARNWLAAGVTLWRLRRQMRVDRPQVVQSFLFHANVLGTLAARLAGVPHILTGVRVAERRARGHLALARLIDRFVEWHVCVSQAVKEFSHTQGKLPVEKLVVIPNGVDLKRFASATPCPLQGLGLPTGRRAILHIGRLDAQKSVAWLLELMPGVLAQLPQHDLVLVGTGRDRESLAELAERLGVGHRVHFVGFRDDVPEILAASDVLVLASRWEGMPNVVLEAMAAGKPVVATDVEGVAEALGPHAPQQVVRARNPADFATRLVEVAKNADLAAELGAANRRQAEQFLTLDRAADAYQQLYRSLASG